MPETRKRVELLLAMTGDAYRKSRWHSLKAHLKGLSSDEMHYRPVPETADVEEKRKAPYIATVAAKLVHVALCKVMYENHAFGGRTLDWGAAWTWLGMHEALETPELLIAALGKANERLRNTLAGLSDDDLDEEVFTNWGEKKPAWWIFNVMIQHDLWHGGQISTLRTLCKLEDARSD